MKAAELRGLGGDQLAAKERELADQLFRMRIQKSRRCFRAWGWHFPHLDPTIPDNGRPHRPSSLMVVSVRWTLRWSVAPVGDEFEE